MVFIALLLIFSLSFFPFIGNAYPENNTLSFTTQSGLKVFLIKDESTDYIGVNTAFNVGSNNDPENQEGLAHLVEHLIATCSFERADKTPILRIDEDDDIAESNAITRDRRTDYYMIGHKSKLYDLLTYCVQALGKLDFKKHLEEIKKHKALVLSEVSYKYSRSFEEVIDIIKMYGMKDRFSRAGFGVSDDIDAITYNDISKFVDSYYCPENAHVLVYGNFDINTVKNFLEKEVKNYNRCGCQLPYIKERQSKYLAKYRKIIRNKQPNDQNVIKLLMPIEAHDKGDLGFVQFLILKKVFGAEGGVFEYSLLNKKLDQFKGYHLGYCLKHEWLYMEINLLVDSQELGMEAEDILIDFIQGIATQSIDEKDFVRIKNSVKFDLIRDMDGFNNSFFSYITSTYLNNRAVRLEELTSQIDKLSSEDFRLYFNQVFSNINDPMILKS